MANENRSWLWGLVVVLVLALVAYAAYQTASVRAQREIARIRADSAALHKQVDDIRAEVQLRDSLKAAIRDVETTLRAEAGVLRDSIRVEEARRQAEQLTTWTLRSTDRQEQAFIEAFPAFREAMRVTEYQRSPDELSLRYLMVPFGASATFIEYKRRSDAFLEQNQLFARLDTLNLEVITLSDSIDVLNERNQVALRMGMDTALAHYDSITQQYIRELERPALAVSVPSKWYFLGGAAAAGLVIGAVRR